MTTWHGYPQHPDAHPERPWWRLVERGFRREAWTRLDGLTHDCWGQDTSEHLGRLDAAHPLPAPEPRCGQVWVVPERKPGRGPWAMMVGGAWRLDGERHYRWAWMPVGAETSEWPPPGAVLVAGPGAPWAPIGE